MSLDDSLEAAPVIEPSVPAKRKELPIYKILGSIDFSDHFVLIGDVGTGKSTVTPIHEFELSGGERQILIREPSRASCSALYYSLEALYPKLRHELAIITKDTRVNVGGRIKIVTDGVLLRMLAENSVTRSSVYFDESHQMSSQLELCMSLAKKEEEKAENLFRIMSATIDPSEFLSFMGISKVHTISGRVHPIKIEVEMAKDLDEMFRIVSSYLYSQPAGESWLVFLPTRRLVEKYASQYRGVYIHGGVDGSEVNKIQKKAELDRNLRIFATNVIASSVNIYLDNVLIFNEAIGSKDSLGQKTLTYKTLDSNSLLQMIGRVGRFKPGRAVILSEVHVPGKIEPTPVKKDLESETPFDLVLLMAKYGLRLGELEFMSKVNHREVDFAEGWMEDIGAIDPRSHEITWKGLLMSELPYEPDFAHMISAALILRDYPMARFLLASGAFGDSLNHAYKVDREQAARSFLYSYDSSNELNVKAHLLRAYSLDKEGLFRSKLAASGVFLRFVEEAWKTYEAAREGLNDLLASEKKEPVPAEVVVDPDVNRLGAYLGDCLSFERFRQHDLAGFNLRDMDIRGPFFARGVTMNNRRILFDVVGLRKRNRRRR